ncbi:MAG: hypothetical protein ACKVQS_05620 [Fimbriimonadaceae bacterium]
MAVISQNLITTIGRTYLKGQLWMTQNGIDHPETVDVALAAETYRYFWRPTEVKTLLFLPRDQVTEPEELSLKVRSSWVKIGVQQSPNSFVRTPYCLGAGEPELINNFPNPSEEKNSPVWHALADLVQRDYSANQEFMLRLEQKARILHELYRLGIWITHPSLHAGQNSRTILSEWWRGPGQETVKESGNPLIIAYGRGLYDDLIACDIPVADYLYHPQGLQSDEHFAHQREAVERVLKFST